jgi:formylglycine-generating enzyme required for sulfatase activity
MARIFISHSSKNDDWAIALRDWLVREGWSGEDDVFLDLDPERGIAAGQRWAHALEDAATRCEAVLFIVSNDWLASKWCGDEYHLASRRNKPLFALLIEDIPLERLPGGLTAQWQVVQLRGEPAERFLTVHPYTRRQSPVHVAETALAKLKRGLLKAGVGPETFELQPDPTGPFGWRAPYRGLEALEPEDAAVFFGRSADIVRGIDALRDLAGRPPPRVLVILGSSGAGKSSFLRAGLWPRLNRDDSQWFPLRAIRAGRGGALEGSEGLLSALEEAHRRLARPASRAQLRPRLATPEQFVEMLRDLRRGAARRALLTEPPYPLAVLCLDQAEELFAADAPDESRKLLLLARAAADSGDALLLFTMRSDSYGLMQNAKVLGSVTAGDKVIPSVPQVPLSLGPVPQGEMASIIRQPAEILRSKVRAAPVFDPAVIVSLQEEIQGESDALPLLAFALQRLMREHSEAKTIGADALRQTGGVAAGIQSEAEAAFGEAGYAAEESARRDALRRLFIPHLAQINPRTKVLQRRTAKLRDLPADLHKLIEALTAHRLLVAKSPVDENGQVVVDAATLEVAHEALLRRWTTLAEVLAQDRDALLLLDGALSAAAEWQKSANKPDFLVHHGSRLADALALAQRGSHWTREIAPASAYLAACRQAEDDRKRRTRYVQSVIYVLLLGIVIGLLGWINQAAIKETANWFLVMRPYMYAQVRPYVLKPDAERALAPKAPFRECARDCPEMIVVPAGEFTMGSPPSEEHRYKDEGPQHKVVIKQAFAVSKFAVTFSEWNACASVGGCPAVRVTDNLAAADKPVINVTWEDAQQYAAWLARMTGKPYRLLTEAEWEYAARAGTSTAYYWGDEVGSGHANCERCGSRWDNRETAPVGSFKPNAFGLYEMLGNVWQWVQDCYNPSYEGAPTDGSPWLQGDCSRRIRRGGGWSYSTWLIRAANRGADSPMNRSAFIGIRIARTLER